MQGTSLVEQGVVVLVNVICIGAQVALRHIHGCLVEVRHLVMHDCVYLCKLVICPDPGIRHRRYDVFIPWVHSVIVIATCAMQLRQVQLGG